MALGHMPVRLRAFPTLVLVMVVMNVEVLMLQGRMLVLEDRGIGGRP
jgi:hypothetical protein